MDIDENIIGDNEVITSKSSMEISKGKEEKTHGVRKLIIWKVN
jgi:hypothetical protein